MEEELKDNTLHVEMTSTTTKGGATEEEIQLQEALRNYVPDTDAEKKLVRKIDLRLMPTLWVMYILNYVDRTNIVGNLVALLFDILS